MPFGVPGLFEIRDEEGNFRRDCADDCRSALPTVR
jgi:hypothetical protein